MKDSDIEASSKKSSKDGKLGSKKKFVEIKRELKEERSRADNHLNKLKYLQAEFENYQKRTKKEIEDSIKYENEKLILKFIEVYDELELAAEAGRKSRSSKLMIEGINMVITKFKEIFDKEGLCKIEAIGKSFDPNLHEAVAQVLTEEYPDNTIIEELKKGYTLHDRVIRPSVVSVAKSKKDEK